MLGKVGLEVMNSIYPDVNWKIATKGRRTRKPVARNLNRVNKSPKRVGDFSGYDSDKFGEAVLGQRSSGKVEHVPIKKRRRMLQSPSKNPRAPSTISQDSSSPQTHSSSSISEDLEQLSDQNHFSGHGSLNSHSNQLSRGFDRSAMVKVSEGVEGTEGELYSTEDFSGIALLAAAACFNVIDDDAGNASKEDHVVENSPIPECSVASVCPPELKVGFSCLETGNSLGEDSVHVHSFRSTLVTDKTAASQSVPESVKDSVVQRSVSSKVDRLHWDLNTVMDVCDELYDDSDIGRISKNINDICVLRGELAGECCGPQEDCDIKGRTSFNLKIEENNVEAFSGSGRTCIEKRFSPTHEQCSMEPVNSYDDMGTSFEASRIVADKNHHAQVVSKHADNETSDQVVDKDAFPDNSALTELPCSSISELKKNLNKISSSVSSMQGEYCCSNMIGFDKPTSSEIVQIIKQNFTSIELPVTEISASGNEDSGKTISSLESDRPDVYISGSNSTEMDIHLPSTCDNLPDTGTFINNDQCVVIADAKDRDEITSVAGSIICDSQWHLKHEELVPKCEDDYVSNGGQGRSVLQDSCKSYSGGAQNVDSTAPDANIGLLDDHHNSDVSQDNHEHMVDGDEVTKLQSGDESPYEDGELRGSVLYSWEENEVEGGENERVDYDSDGRNDIVSEAAEDYPVSEIVEGGSDASLCTKKRIPLTKGFSETDLCNGGLVKRYLRRPFTDSDTEKEMGGKLESNAESSITIEQSVDMVVEQNDCSLRRRRMVGQADAFDGIGSCMDEHGPRTSRSKLQSRIEGPASFGATDEKDAFMQQYRSHHFGGSYSLPEKDGSYDKYRVRYKPASHLRERDGGDSHWMHWGSRNHYSSRNHRLDDHGHSRPRSGINETKFVGLDSHHDPRQSAFYSSKGLFRPPVKRSLMDRDECFGVNRRMSLARGISGGRSRGNSGNYSPGVGRDTGEDFHEPVTGDAAASTVRLRRYFSRERSYSPNTGRGSHISFTRKSCSRSRSNSPQSWHLHRERNLSTRRYSRSPDFRSDTRTERMRLPFPKRRFASDGGESYMSPPKRYPSPRRRLVDDQNFGGNHLRHRRSPVRMFGRNQKFDTSGSSGQIKSDDSFRSMFRPGRFSLMASADGGSKFKESYEDRRLDDRCEMIRSRKRVSEVDGSIRRFPCDASSNFETSNPYNEDDVRVTDRRDVPRSSREVKRSFNA